MVTISLCMIVKNEARNLPRCLDAVRAWVDEIVVVDTGSTDGTQALARARGARVEEWAWRDDFAAARNESLRHATGDWILVLDADEALTAGSGPALREAVAEATADVVGCLVKILCPREGDGGVVRLNWFPRLFRRVPGVAFEGVIHEQVVASLAPHGRVVPSRVEALHEGYRLSPEEMAGKAERNRRLLERQLRDDPTYAPGWFQLAETFVLQGRLDDGIDAYRRCLCLLETSRLTLPPGVVAVALQNLGATLLAKGERAEGVRHIEAALEIIPGLAPAHVHLGNAALAAGEWEQAERHFARALEAAARPETDGEYEISPWLMHFLRGCAQARQGKLVESIASYEAALAIKADHAESLWLLALSAANGRDGLRALDALDRLGALGRDDFPYRAQRALTLSALGRPAEAAEAAARALALEPASAPMQSIAAENLARAERPAEAAAAYERLLAAQPEAVPAWLALAQCRERAGDHPGMMDAYGRAATLAPDSPEVLFALGSACLRQGALEPAQSCLAAAVEGAPERPDYRINHALALVKGGRPADAAAALDQALARWPANTPLREARALVERFARLALAGATA
jgi:tetratricopeptide (TPR) repeat protein